MTIEFLAQMAWKTAAIAAGALALSALLRSRPADERAAVLRAAFVLILALPLLTMLLPALPVVTFAAPEAASLPSTLPAADLAAALQASSADTELAPAPASVLDDPTPLILLAWLGGFAMVMARLLAGLWTLRRWTLTGEEVECPHWRAAFDVAATSPRLAATRLLESDAPSPLGWGWLRPVILVDRDTIRSPEEAEAVLAHELAHVERRDWLVLVLARVAVALFWFNPLLWLLERRMVNEAEEAADARALARIEPARYAQTLLSCAAQNPGMPATAIANTGLARRVRRILEGRMPAGAPNRRALRIAASICVLVAAPIAALKPVAASLEEPPLPPPAPEAPEAPAATAAPRALLAPPAPSAAPAPTAPSAPLAPAAPPSDDPDVAGLAPIPGVPFARPAMPAPPAPFAVPAMPALAMAPAVPPTPPVRRYRHRDAWTEEDQRELERDLAEAGREAREAAEQIRRDMPRIAAEARAAARAGIAAGAEGMAAGAAGMEGGARGMEAEADRLRSPEYRATQIAKAARRGEHVTDRELQDLIPKLRAGAEKLRRSAVEMRRNAEKMRRGES